MVNQHTVDYLRTNGVVPLHIFTGILCAVKTRAYHVAIRARPLLWPEPRLGLKLGLKLEPRLTLAALLAASQIACVSDLAPLSRSSFSSAITTTGRSNTVTVPPSQSTLTAPKARDAQRSDYSQSLLNRFALSDDAPVSTALGAEPVTNTSPEMNSSVNAIERSAVARYTVEAVRTPVQAVLFSLAKDAGLQVQFNGTFETRVTLNSHRQPLNQILQSLADQVGFSWQQQLDQLTFWSGQAYSESYPVNYLNITRRTQSSVGLATRVGTINASDANGDSVANSSQTRIENSSEHDFWSSLLNDVESLLKQTEHIDIQAVSEFSINREAGLISLYSTPDVHRNLQRYLAKLLGNAQRQVLIEATVVEVALSNNFEAGVDWQVLARGITGVNAAQVLLGAPAVTAETIGRLTNPAGLATLVQSGGAGDITATLSLLEQFGDVRILSRPRIIALNNQSSVLKVVDNRVYFTVNVQRRQSEDQDEIVTETEIHTVPVGLVMNVTPQISEQGTVMLNVRPTLSRILGFVNDPNPELALANVQNGVPEIQVREMESMLQVNSGDIAIIGGLMQETESEKTNRLPGLAKLPGIGKLFTSQNRERRQTELLIVLKPTVIGQAQQGASRK